MPHFDWATATDGFLGAVLGGAVTGGAIFLTIRHDRAARRDDRLHASADRALLAAAELLASALTDDPAREVLGKVVLFTNASITFLARMQPDDPARKLIDGITDVLAARALDFGRAPTHGRRRLLAPVRAYLVAVGAWLLTPGAYVPTADATALVAGYDAIDAQTE